MNNYKQYYFFISLIFFYLFGLQVYYAWPYTVDDAYITLRYANHLANHQSILWNLDGSIVEGYSNFSYLLLEAFFIKLGLNGITAIKTFSIIALLFSCIGCFKLSKLWLPNHLAILAPIILLMHPGEIIWTVSGLETVFYQAIIIFSIYFFLNQKHKSAGLLLAVAGMTRPEAPMILLILIGLRIFEIFQSDDKNEKEYYKKSIYQVTFAFMILYLPYLSWRLYYFGRLFPNPVYCKTFTAPSKPFKLSISYFILIFPLLAPCFFLIKKSNFKLLYLLTPSIAYLIALINADWIVGYLDRHFLAAFGLITPLFIIGLHRLFQHQKLNLSKRIQNYAVIFYAILSGLLFTHQGYTLQRLQDFARDGQDGNQLRIELSNWLSKHVPSTAYISLGDCGLIPYLHDGHFIDSYCINNPEFTLPPINFSYPKFTDWLLKSKQPGVIILIGLISANTIYYPPAEKLLLKNKLFYKNYKSVRTAQAIQPNTTGKTYGYFYQVYKKKNLTALM